MNIVTFVLFYLDLLDQTKVVFLRLSRLSCSCENDETQGEGKRERGRESQQHSRIHIIFPLSVTPLYLLAFPALSKAPSISIPPSSPTSSFSGSGFICLCSVRFQSVEIRVQLKKINKNK